MTSTIPPSASEQRHPVIWRWLKWILPVVVVIAGVVIMQVMIATAPKAERKTPPRTARLVDTLPVARTNLHAVVSAMGMVHPAREVTLHPQVGGTVIEVHPELIPGGIKAAGDVLLRIDPKDYELALRRAESALAAAEGDYQLELGQQALARKEFELLGRGDLSEAERALILREPQRAQAEAALASARAALDQARLDLERTTITAPFHAIVRSRSTDLGAQVSPPSPLATLTDVEAYWIIAPVPVSQLAWLAVPERAGETGAAVRVLFAGQPAREGRVLRLLNELETDGRMAQLLIEVRDPLALAPDAAGLPKLLLGDFVRIEIDGRWTEDVVALDRRWLRNHNEAWVLADGRLEIRTLDIPFRGEREVLVRAGLESGELVVTTDIAAPVAGMLLTTGETNKGGGAP